MRGIHVVEHRALETDERAVGRGGIMNARASEGGVGRGERVVGDQLVEAGVKGRAFLAEAEVGRDGKVLVGTERASRVGGGWGNSVVGESCNRMVM